ncbi:MAG: DUF5602 domain-containing protein [Bacteroidota bacterium]|nr:DUF5602 domain-containing protein [Bacteroidota bacterium]
MMLHLDRFLALAAVSLLVFTSACSEDDPVQVADPIEYRSESMAFGGGTMHAWERADADGNLLAVGVTFDEAVLDELPQDMAAVHIDFPGDVAVSPFTMMGFDWNPAGHEPGPIYGLPHFDVHFYVVSEQDLAAVTPGPDMTPVPAPFVPQDYVSGVDAVPNMGTHWIDTTASEFHGSTFDKTFIYGFYDGNLFFMEPMITLAYLETKPDVTIDIKQPQQFPMPGKMFPAQYRISHDAVAGTYTVELTGMKLQQ